MPQPVKHIACDPNTQGRFEHTLFLGCSIMSFSASAGLNEQTAEVTVQLVEDPCDVAGGGVGFWDVGGEFEVGHGGPFIIPSPKYYYDCTLTKQEWLDADPGFYGLLTNIIGAPAYFRIGNFEFSGLIQRWTETKSQSGNPTYEVVLVSPNAILSNSQVIINDYAGSVGNTYNLFNAFGYRETFGVTCNQYYQSSPGTYSPGDGSVDGAVFGSPAGAYGGSDVNRNGMQWNEILAATRILTASFPRITNQWSPYGRCVFKSHTAILSNCMGLIPYDIIGQAYYYLDLSDLPLAPSYWRFNGTSVNLLDTISQICQDAGYDYYVQLAIATKGALGSGIHKFIKVRTIDRNPIRSLTEFDTYVTSDVEPISYRSGNELRNEFTQSFVIGGPKQSFYQGPQDLDPEGDGDPTPPTADDLITPYMGLDNNGNVIMGDIDSDGWWYWDIPTDDLAAQLSNTRYGVALPAYITINEQELLAADASLSVWSTFASSWRTNLWLAIGLAMSGEFHYDHIVDMLKTGALQAGDNLRALDFPALHEAAFVPQGTSIEVEVMEITYAWIKKLVDEYYGKKFMVRVPFTCGRTDSESDIILTSEQPSDGGWTEVTPVLELAHPSIYTDFFTLNDNRLGAFCRYDDIDTLEPSNLAINDFVTIENKAWIKIGVEPEYVYLDRETLFAPRAVITLPQVIREIGGALSKSMNGLYDILTKFLTGSLPEANVQSEIENVFDRAGGKLIGLPGKTRPIMPAAVGFGIKSNILTYGPWGAGTTPGGVKVTQDEGLVPWEYGGFVSLDLAGNATAAEGVTNDQVEEGGTVTVAGYPTIPLGAELRSASTGGPFAGSGGLNLVENRVTNVTVQNGINTYTVPIVSWIGTYGPNVTRVTCEVSLNGIQTTYELRTWTAKFGKFARYNAERIKQIGQNRLQYDKNLRSYTLQRIRDQQRIAFNQAVYREASKPGEDRRIQNASPHETLVGQLLTWDDGNFIRPAVMSESAADLGNEIANSYDDKAFMSLDGLLRPVSMDGDGNLPQYFVYQTGCQATASRGAVPPLDKENEGGMFNQYNQPHTLDHLNPFTNPSSVAARNTIATELSDTSLVGHDIEVVGRATDDGGLPPASSMVMPIEGWAATNDTSISDHKDDYRFLVLRGPLLMQGPGYDLDGFPVPNKVDTAADAKMGIFEATGLEMKFMDNHMRRSDAWPVAPIDLRLDRERGVWTVPHFRNQLAELLEDVPEGESGIAKVIDGPELYDTSGEIIKNPEILVYDVVITPGGLASGTKVITYYDGYECEHRILSSSPCASGKLLENECMYTGLPAASGEEICEIPVITGVEYLGCVVCCACCTEEPQPSGSGSTGPPVMCTPTQIVLNEDDNPVVLGGVGEFNDLIPYVMTHYKFKDSQYIPTEDEGNTLMPRMPRGPWERDLTTGEPSGESGIADGAACECYIYAKFNRITLNFNACGLFIGKSDPKSIIFEVPSGACEDKGGLPPGLPSGDCTGTISGYPVDPNCTL